MVGWVGGLCVQTFTLNGGRLLLLMGWVREGRGCAIQKFNCCSVSAPRKKKNRIKLKDNFETVSFQSLDWRV